MKRIFLYLLFITLLIQPVMADDITEDFLDIAANYCIQGNYDEAINYVNKAIAHEPNNPDLVTIKNGIYRIKSADAKSYLTSKNPAIKTAEECRKSGDKNSEFNTLLKGANEKNPWATYYLAEYYRQDKQYNTALNYYDKTLELKEGFAQCYLGITLTLINLNLKNYVDAQADVITALSISDDIEYKLLEGKILYYRGDYKSAKDTLISLTSCIKTAELYKYLGLCDYKLQDYNNALLNLNTSIILSDEDNEVKNKYNEVKSKLTNGNQNG